MLGPSDDLKGYLFHICRDQRITKDHVEYLDLLLDIWIDVDGQTTILDRDQVEAFALEGVLNREDLAWIARQVQVITENRKNIIFEMACLMSRY
jgi:predicted RNA-binding protein associated with RNAse of E/G family